MAEADSEGVTTLCENCGVETPTKDTHSCPACGLDPLCPSCVCEDCPGDEDDSSLEDDDEGSDLDDEE